ncbi:hypothetical protein JFX23_08395 [Schaalia cardiffensis]|uniref:hypothetical protein n=1 Tax=Schaalia cardiffensis TaxID=181487 RepID=UPI0018E859E0|nr:hypothetical protein [Schaalia cardiffensis]MBJ2329777.1 hypothetical protein [Schaalia cardiffensis]
MIEKAEYKTTILQPLAKSKKRIALVNSAANAVNAPNFDRDKAMDALALADVSTLFAIDDSLNDIEVAAQLDAVSRYLNAFARLQGSAPLQRLLNAIRNRFSEDVEKLHFWHTLREAAAELQERVLVDLAKKTAEVHPLKVLTLEEAVDLATRNSLEANDFIAALENEGIRAFPALELPSVRADSPALTKDLDAALRSPVDVLLFYERHPASGIRIIDEFSVENGSKRRPICADDARKSKAHADASGGDTVESVRKALQAMGSDESDVHYHDLCFRWFVDLAEQLLNRDGLLANQTRDQLVERGLDEVDACRIASHAAIRSGAQGMSIADIAPLLAAGDLISARRVLDAFAPAGAARTDLDYLHAKESVEEREQVKARALDDLRLALVKRDIDECHALLTDLARVDRTDPVIEDLARQIPPLAPADVQAVFDPKIGSVRLRWKTVPGLVYTIRRRAAGFAGGSEEILDLPISDVSGVASACDNRPVIGARTTYFVTGRNENGIQSSPVDCTVPVFPPISSPTSWAEATSVGVRWKCPSASTGARVTIFSDDGHSTLPDSTVEEASVEGLTIGSRLRFEIVALYSVQGRIETAAPVSIEVISRGKIHAVGDLQISSDARTVSWSAVPGYTTELWSLPVGVPHPRYGEVRTVEDLEDIGASRAGQTISRQKDKEEVRLPVLDEIRVLLPVTWDSDSALIGRSILWGSVPPMRELIAERRGSNLLVSWLWPYGRYEAFVEWEGEHSGSRHIGRTAYKQAGGVIIPDADSVSLVRVRAVLKDENGDIDSAPLEYIPTRVTRRAAYKLRISRPLFGSPKADIELSTENYEGSLECVLVLSQGRYMPNSPEDGQVVSRFAANLSVGKPFTTSVHFNRTNCPYWIRLFSLGDVELIDPPTQNLKG